MSQPNTANLENSDIENRINSQESAVSVINLEAPATSIAGKRFHFIGAGGVGMSGLAQLLIKNSGLVTGSDQDQTAVTDRLCGMGAIIKIGHNVDNLDPATDAVVISAAINENNPELKLARSKGLKI